MPLDRGERYEDPLGRRLPSGVSGRSRAEAPCRKRAVKSEYVGLDLTLTDLHKGIPFVCTFLEERGAAKAHL